MRWEIHPKGSTIGYAGYAEKTPLTEAVRELWRKYLEEAASKNARMEWDHLRAEIWLDSGRVILFPAIFSFRYRTEKAVCQIICPDLLASYTDKASSNMRDEQFESWAKAEEIRVVSLVSSAAREMNLAQSLGRPSVRVLYYGTDLTNAVREDNFNA
jgi:hypothetical protein